MSNIFVYEPFYDIDRLFEEVLSPQDYNHRQLARQANMNNLHRSSDGAVRMFRPRMDLHEDNDRNQVLAMFEFPGASKDDVRLELHNGRLVVSADIKQPNGGDDKGCIVHERRYGKYSRTLQLSPGVKEQDIKASMRNGVLTILFPKSTAEATARRIPVNGN